MLYIILHLYRENISLSHNTRVFITIIKDTLEYNIQLVIY